MASLGDQQMIQEPMLTAIRTTLHHHGWLWIRWEDSWDTPSILFLANRKTHPSMHQALLLCMHIRKWLITGASLVAQMVKNLPAIQETQVRSLSQEDPLEKGKAAHSSILACWKTHSSTPGLLVLCMIRNYFPPNPWHGIRKRWKNA